MASSSTSNPYVVQTSLSFFKGDNYDRWSVRMPLFRSPNLWNVVEEGVAKKGTDAHKMEKQQDDAKALYLLQQAVDESIFD